MIHPSTELRLVDPIRGLGVFATAPIPKGTLLWVGDRFDLVVSAAARDLFPPHLRETFVKYTYYDSARNLVLRWDISRYFNHSCEPNSFLCADHFEIAVRDIAQDTEIVNDYGSLNIDANEQFACVCGSSRCRSRVTMADSTVLAMEWSKLIADALSLAPSVPQPLWELLNQGLFKLERRRRGVEVKQPIAKRRSPPANQAVIPRTL